MGFGSGVDGLTIVINWVWKSVKGEKKVLKERWNCSSRRKERRSLRVSERRFAELRPRSRFLG